MVAVAVLEGVFVVFVDVVVVLGGAFDVFACELVADVEERGADDADALGEYADSSFQYEGSGFLVKSTFFPLGNVTHDVVARCESGIPLDDAVGDDAVAVDTAVAVVVNGLG